VIAITKVKFSNLGRQSYVLRLFAHRFFLFDRKGAERVSVKTVVRTAWRTSGSAPAVGWLVAGKDGKPGRVYFTDGASIPAPPAGEMEKIDFDAA
jgi:hypothetical protein